MENGRRDIKAHLALAEKIAAVVSRLKTNEPLKNHTTFRVGGPARFFAEVHTPAELAALRALAIKEKLPVFVLGAGSNVLFGDLGFPGVVVRLLGEFAEFRFEDMTVRAGAGTWIGVLVNQCAENGLSGLEGLAGVPGTLGGALVGNAGTAAGWIGDAVASVDVLSEAGKAVTLGAGDLRFAYRGSNLEGKVVLSAVLNLKKAPKNDIVNKINELMLRRSRTQPIGVWNAGSVFKNPPDNSAGRLIETCGLKGVRFGGAQVSEKHANFIVNTGQATASDIRALITMIHAKVKERFGISLDLEIKIAGE